MASRKYEYKFVSPPDDNLKCVICLEVALNPKQHEDCGKLFCSECIEKNGNKPCPNCRAPNPRYFKDKRGEREIKDLRVKCANMERGCGWTGTIATLDNHMSTCQFALVPCPNKCEDDGELTIMRKDLDKHLRTKCPNRAHRCQHCGEKGTYANITKDHDKVCSKKIVACPNKEKGCPLSMERGKTQQHVRSVCDYTEVACTYESLGCTVRMLRKDVEKHERETRDQHLTFSLSSVRTLMLEQHKTLAEGEALVFKIPEYSSKKKNENIFFSNAFYSCPEGYKMRIKVYIHGSSSGAGTHLSVFTNILDGPYDSQLHWPFIGNVTYELLNQLADDKHHRRVITFDASDDMQVGSSIGLAKFLPHSSLSYDPATNTQYLLDDTLYFRVLVTVDNHKPWLVCTDKINMDTTRAIKDSKTLKDGEPMVFKVTGYKDMKAINAVCLSDSFYTGPGGYKVCIGVGCSTHVSVYIKFLEGVYDASLSWPFRGNVSFTLLNQIADDNHHIIHVECEGNELARPGRLLGKHQLIAHSKLSHDPVRNTQYLKDDTLYFKVSVTVASHKSWLMCTHHE